MLLDTSAEAAKRPQSWLETLQRTPAAAALIAFIVTLAALLPSTRLLPEHLDEAEYAWTAAYFGGKLVRLDLAPSGSHEFTDPGWWPHSHWALTQPMGARAIYAITMGLTGAPAPTQPYAYHDPALQGPESHLIPSTMHLLRLMAALCASLGLALITLRFGWSGLAATLILLSIPFVPSDLARAWAEGPMLLGIGLCAITFRTRWFPVACGLAATLKLTALGLWPLMLWPGASGRGRWAPLLGPVVALLLWTALTPPAWFAGGPFYLKLMLDNRMVEYASQSIMYPTIMGRFVATRYLVPFELLAALALAQAVPRLWRRLPADQRDRLTQRA